jgi:hypothetical protein
MIETPMNFISLESVKFFDVPYYDGIAWNELPLKKGEHRIYLSETRAALLGVPVRKDEEPAAYMYSVYGNEEECYFPVYDRTYEIDYEKLYPVEIASI